MPDVVTVGAKKSEVPLAPSSSCTRERQLFSDFRRRPDFIATKVTITALLAPAASKLENHGRHDDAAMRAYGRRRL